jgi:hypothetical protein
MMRTKLLTTIALALSLTIGTAASIATAQEAGKPDTGMMGSHSGMMEGRNGMMGNRGGMMEMMKGIDPTQMKHMVENCNKMMERMVQNMPTVPTAPVTPETDKRG